MQARARGLVALALMPAMGCSFALTRRPPPLPLEAVGAEVRCTDDGFLSLLELTGGTALTVVGLAGAAYGGITLGQKGSLAMAPGSRQGALDATGSASSSSDKAGWLAASGAGILFLASGIYGRTAIKRCREIKAHVRDCHAGDAPACALLLHPDEPLDWSLPAWLGQERGAQSTSPRATPAEAPPAASAPDGTP
jgi:hypothetical protein